MRLRGDLASTRADKLVADGRLSIARAYEHRSAMAQKRKATKRKGAQTSSAPKKKAASKRGGAAKKKKSSGAKKKKATPWERPAPSRTKHTQLNEADKSKAKKRARRAGRPYPNLVDNMTVAKQKAGTKKRSTSRRKKSS